MAGESIRNCFRGDRRDAVSNCTHALAPCVSCSFGRVLEISLAVKTRFNRQKTTKKCAALALSGRVNQQLSESG